MMMKNKKKGFTLVELVIVIAVIAILAGVMIATFSNVVSDAQASADLQEVKSSLDATYLSFVTENGDVPNAFLVNVKNALHSEFKEFAVLDIPAVIKDSAATWTATGADKTETVKITVDEKGKPIVVNAKNEYKFVLDVTYTYVEVTEQTAEIFDVKSVELVSAEKYTYKADDSVDTTVEYGAKAEITGKNGTVFTVTLITDEDSVNYGSYTITENK